jgi:hypothetical protein
MKALPPLMQLVMIGTLLPCLACAEEAPVELVSSGLSPDKAHVSYKIKVNSDKPINEVHLNLKETDGQGKVVVETTLVWANIVHSTRQPIEKGKTYEDDSALSPGAVAAECSLKEVVFKDFTRWSATAPVPTTPGALSSGATGPKSAPPAVPRPVASPPAPPSKPKSDTQEAESFIKSFYHDMEQDDTARVLGYFDEAVDYYSYGQKDKAFIGEQLQQYFATYPVRSFTVSKVKFQPASASRASATFEVRYSIGSSGGTPTTGRSNVEWELVKRDGVAKIIRFNGTSTPDS